MYISVIIPTRNRVKMLINSINSIIKEKTLPDEIIIVDSSNYENHIEIEKKTSIIENENQYINFILIKSKSGLPHQRNIGISHLSKKSELVFFLDDDIELRSDYIGYFQDFFITNQNAYAAMPYIDDVSRKSKRSIFGSFLRKFFLLSEVKKIGKMKKSGYAVLPFKKRGKAITTKVLCGIFTCRKPVLVEYEFDVNLKDWAFMEDIDFSIRISQKYNLYYVPSITIKHLGMGTINNDKKHEFLMRIYNHWYLFNKNRKIFKGVFLFYLWSLIGFFLFAISTSLRVKNISPIRGYIKGIIKIITSKIN